MAETVAEQIALPRTRDTGDDGISPRIRPELVGAMALLFLALDTSAYYLPATAAFAVVAAQASVILLAAVVNARAGLICLTVSVILAEDISRYGEDVGEFGFSTLMSVPVLDIALGNWVALGVVGVALFFALLRWIETRETVRLVGPDYTMIGILALYAAASAQGYEHLLHNLRGALNDLNLPLMAAGLYLAVRVHFRDGESILRLFQCIIASLAAKSIVWVVYYFLGKGQMVGFSVWTSLESGRPVLVLLLVYGLVLQQRHLMLRPVHRYFALGLVLAAAFNILVHVTRMAWLESVYGCLILLALGRVGDKLRWITLGGTAVFLVLVSVLIAKPDALQTIGYFASTLDLTDRDKVTGSHSTMVRVYEFRNISTQLWARGRAILGEGPGSTFTDAYHPFPFQVNPGSDYKWDEIRTRRFENAHGLLQNLLLNTGFGGTAFYLLLMLTAYLACFRAYLHAPSPCIQAVALALVAYLPGIVYDSWSAKNNMTLGVLLAVVAGLAALARDHAAGETRDAAPGHAHRDAQG